MRSIAFIFILLMTFKCAADSKPAVIVQPTNSSPEKKIAITNSPITLRYMGVGTDQKLISPKGLGYSFTSGPVFWVTNHTTNTLVLDLALESKSGTNWIIDAQPGSTYPVHHLLAFKKKEKVMKGGKEFFWTKDVQWLSPHEAAYATPMFWTQPTNTWRVAIKIQEQLNGISKAIAAAKMYPDLLQRRIMSGNTNLPLNLLRTNVALYGPPIEILSEEFPAEK